LVHLGFVDWKKEMTSDENYWKKSSEDLEKFIQESIAKQIDWAKNSTFNQMDVMRNFLSSFQRLTQFAMFKTNVQRGGRISIPEAERQTVGIEEGMPVQVIIFPLEKKVKEEKKE
jgi:hypothetical protein